MNNLIILLVSLVAIAQAQIPGIGPCPTVTVKTDLDPAKFSGKWYQQEKYFSVQEMGKCIKTDYWDLFGLAYIVTQSEADVLTSAVTSQMGVSIATGPRTTGNQIMAFPSNQIPLPIPYSILETDHTSYAVTYSCIDLGLFHTKFAWIWTRDRIPSATIMSLAYGAFTKNNLDKTILMKTDQTNCPANY